MVFFSLLPYTTIFDAIRRLTKKRILDGRRDGKAHSVPAAHEKAHFGPRPHFAPHGKTALCILCMLCAASHRVSDLSLG